MSKLKSKSKTSKTASTRRVTSRMCEAVVDDEDEVAKAALVQARRRETLFQQRFEARDRKRSAVDRLNDPPPAPLPALLKRVSNAIERELTQIEGIIGTPHLPLRQRTEGERRARVLASLARTLREVMQLRRSEEKAREDDDALPRDIDELRDKLARRLDELAAGAKAAYPDEADG